MILENIKGNIRWRDLRSKSENGENRYLCDLSKDLISKLLHHSPNERIGCGDNGVDEVKNHPFLKGVSWEKLEKKLVVPPFQPNLAIVNAEFQDGYAVPSGTVKNRKEIKKLSTPEFKKALDNLRYTRPGTFDKELIGSTILVSNSEKKARYMKSAVLSKMFHHR